MSNLVAFEGEQFPYSHGTINGVKCCSKCGATKTPQWREGPCGPKTLCNACGVKRTRRRRAELEQGAKRRRLSASPAPSQLTRTHAAPTMDSYGSLEPDSEAWALPGTTGAAQGLRRPARRAAEEAALKTARYARTGEWAEGQAKDSALYDEALRAATPTSSSDGYSMPSSTCHEEVCWPPAAGGDCYAAINLLTMSSAGQTAADQPAASSAFAASATPSPASAPALKAFPAQFHVVTAIPASAAMHSDAEQCSQGSLAALQGSIVGGSIAGSASPPHLHHHHHHHHYHQLPPVALSDLGSCLPPAKVLELVRLNEELDLAVREAQAANAAVAAVAQVLAAKQAAALRSRDVVGSATKCLRRFMAELDTQFGINSKCGSGRPPLSPTRPTGMALSPPARLRSTAALSPVAPLLAPFLPPAPYL